MALKHKQISHLIIRYVLSNQIYTQIGNVIVDEMQVEIDPNKSYSMILKIRKAIRGGP